MPRVCLLWFGTSGTCFPVARWLVLAGFARWSVPCGVALDRAIVDGYCLKELFFVFFLDLVLRAVEAT